MAEDNARNSKRSPYYGDSDLVVKQLNGKWKARAYLSYYKEAIRLRAKLPEVVIKWIPREQNGHADYLSKKAINRPRSSEENQRLAKLIEAQRRDRHDPRFVVVASQATKGAPF